MHYRRAFPYTGSIGVSRSSRTNLDHDRPTQDKYDELCELQKAFRLTLEIYTARELQFLCIEQFGGIEHMACIPRDAQQIRYGSYTIRLQ